MLCKLLKPLAEGAGNLYGEDIITSGLLNYHLTGCMVFTTTSAPEYFQWTLDELPRLAQFSQIIVSGQSN